MTLPEASAQLQDTGSAAQPSEVTAVVVTRDRIPMLRRTIASMMESAYPLAKIVVSDDSKLAETREMLELEYPEILYVSGPRRGISANRNVGMSFVETKYILLSDDDMLLDSRFLELAVHEIEANGADLVFTGTGEYGRSIFPNALDFLGFATKRYEKGDPYTTANQQCFVLTRELARAQPYDETIASYGYEEMEYAYRVAAAGYKIASIGSCVNLHLAPNSEAPFRYEQDAARLYVTFKRYAFVDKRPIKAICFLFVALPHHVLASIRRSGLMLGIRQALSNFRLSLSMLRKHSARYNR